MNLKFVLSLALCFLSNFVSAQKEFKPGFIIQNSGDTIFGEIDYRSDYLMSNVCTFKSSDDLITKYYPETIRAYRFFDGKYYVSRKINDNYYFLEYLINGKIDIFYLKKNSGNYYYIENDTIPLTEIPYEENIRNVENKNVLYQSKTHVRMLKYIMQDAPELQRKIDNIKKPEHQNLINIAQEYHQLICKDEECIVYEKKSPTLNVDLEPLFGLTKYKFSDNKWEKGIGINIFLWLPRANERIFLKTGFSFYNISYEDQKVFAVKYPIQLGYIYPTYRLKPVIGAGYTYHSLKLETYKAYNLTITLSFGLYFQINNSVSLGSSYSTDLIPLSILNDDGGSIVSNSLHLGLYINL